MGNTNAVADTLSFFVEARPEPTSKDQHTQLGVHFEEVAEMVEEMVSEDPHTSLLLHRAHYALSELGDHLKKNDQKIEIADRIKFLDSLCDQKVTAIGVGHHYRFDMIGAFNEVNRSNLSKFDENGKAIFNEDGKIMKGPNYSPADLAPFV